MLKGNNLTTCNSPIEANGIKQMKMVGAEVLITDFLSSRHNQMVHGNAMKRLYKTWDTFYSEDGI